MKAVSVSFRFMAATMFLAAAIGLAQEVRITSLNASGEMRYALSPTGTVADYSCWLEWCPTLRDHWTNAWHQPFAPFSESGGISSASLPQFFRVVCTTGNDQGTNGPAWTNYTVTGVVPASISDGVIRWPTGSNTALVYHVEYAAFTNAGWPGRWDYRTNIHATAAVTNLFRLPMFFRVVTIKANDGGEVPWP